MTHPRTTTTYSWLLREVLEISSLDIPVIGSGRLAKSFATVLGLLAMSTSLLLS